MYKLICISGMPGAGKSVASDFFVKKGYKFVRFGQITLNEIKRRKLKPSEANQKQIREEFRKIYGMDAYAKLNYPVFKKLLKKNNVIADGLYSWSEYKFLKDKFGRRMLVIAIFAPPLQRYSRLSKRKPSLNDKNLRNHHFSEAEAKLRDYNEIENIEKGGPIAMADHTLLNTKDITFLNTQLESVFDDIESI